MLIDSHCHLLHCYNGTSEIPVNEIETEFSYILNILINEDEIKRFFKNPIQSKVIFNAFGLYPELAKNFNSNMEKNFIKLVEKHKPLAIGEIGIDYHWDYGDFRIQEKLFRFQLEIAIEKNLPVIIHSREAYNDTYRVLKSYNFRMPVIMHCFGYGIKEALSFIDSGYYISFAGNVTYPNANSLKEVVKSIPLSKILVETDAPYLSPFPLRGKRNTPFNIKYTYEFLANLLELNLTDFKKIILANFKNAFGLFQS